MRNIFLFWLMIFFLPFLLRAQQVTIPMEQNPPNVKWEQINTPHFRIIYPLGFDTEAQRMANTLEHIYTPVSKTLGKEPRRISILLQNRSSISNGFVTLLPRRSEFYTTPPQDYNFLGINDWMELLAVHEFRHVVQYDKSITGINRLAYFLFGNTVLTGLGNISAPPWFWEGDAVATETALTPAGRGRAPNFDLLYRTNLLERGAFRYHKAHLGSFRHAVPDHYVLGYHFTSFLRRRYGNHFLDTVSQRAFARSIIPFTFSNALKHQSGKYLVPLYKDMNRELDSLWRKQIENLPVTEATLLTKRTSSRFTNYDFPNYLRDGRIVVLRSGIGDIQQFVAIDKEGNEEVLFTPGIISENAMLSVVNDQIVWSEYGFDPRWAVQNYQVIKTFYIQSKGKVELTRNSRLSAPALSPAGSKIVAIEISAQSQCSVVLLDVRSGGEIKRFDNPENHFFSMPRFSEDGEKIVVLRTVPHKGRTIALIDVESGKITDLLPYTNENTGHPVLWRNYLYFNSPYSGIDNIYAMNILSGKRWQVTSRKYGAYNPCISQDGQKILFNDFQRNGMEVMEMPNDSTKWIPIEQVQDRRVNYFQPIADMEANPDLLKGIPANKYETRPYSKSKNIFNIHSWLPSSQVDDRGLTLGIVSQDLLSTTQMTTGFILNANERTGAFFGGISYQGWYPVINVNGRFANRAVTQKVDTNSVRYSWQEQGFDVGMRIPLVLTNSKFLRSLQVGVKTSLLSISGDERPRVPGEQRNGTLHSMNYSLLYASRLKRSVRDIFPRWGWTTAVNFTNTPFGGDYKGKLFAAEMNGYVPGFFRHHGFRVRTSYQHEEAKSYQFTTPLLFPRGYAYRSHLNFYGASAEYRFPVVYPDVALGPLVNMQRIKGGFFSDYGYGEDADISRTYQSFGVDLSTDLNIMRFPGGGIDIGVRYIYRPDIEKGMFRLTFGLFGL